MTIYSHIQYFKNYVYTIINELTHEMFLVLGNPILCRKSGYEYQILWAVPFVDRLGTV
jgi:hypothetical protein